MDELAAAIASLRINARQQVDGTTPDHIEDDRHTSLPNDPVRSIRRKLSADELKKQLEQEFLTPSPRFNLKWLDELQKWVGLIVLDSRLATSPMNVFWFADNQLYVCVSWLLDAGKHLLICPIF